MRKRCSSIPKAWLGCVSSTRLRRAISYKKRSRPSLITQCCTLHSRTHGRHWATRERLARPLEKPVSSQAVYLWTHVVGSKHGTHATAQKWDEATRIYATLFTSSPDDIDIGLQLANSQIEGGDIAEALVTLEALRALPEPLALDPRIDLSHARASYHQGRCGGDAGRRLERAAHRGKALEAPLLVAEARLRQTTALQALGKHEQAMKSLEEAKRLFEAHGDRQGSARAIELIGIAVKDRGDLDGARRLLEKALAIYDEIGNRGLAADLRINACRDTQRSRATAEGCRSLRGTAGNVQRAWRQTLRDHRSQRAWLQPFSAGRMAGGDPEIFRGTDTWQTSWATSKGLLSPTQTSPRSTMSWVSSKIPGECMRRPWRSIVRSGINSGSLTTHSAWVESSQPVAISFWPAAITRRRWPTQDELGFAAAAAETRIALAALELDQDNAEAAEPLARAAEEMLRNQGFSGLATLAGTALVRALLLQGRLAEARETMADVEASAGRKRRSACAFGHCARRGTRPRHVAGRVLRRHRGS